MPRAARSRAAPAFPDLGLLTASEVADRMAEIAAAVQIPVIADFDTGYGNALNAQRAARFFLRSGVAGDPYRGPDVSQALRALQRQVGRDPDRTHARQDPRREATSSATTSC